MATFSDAVHDVKRANAILAGSKKRQKERRYDLEGFLRFARKVGALRGSITQIEEWVVSDYAQYYQARGLSAGQLENVFASIRVVFCALGKDISKTCSNQQLGLPRRVRKGSRLAPAPAEIEALIGRAEKIDKGLAILILLARYLGLRRMEALMCGPDLQMWLEAIAAGAMTIDVMRGAKNGRPRTVELLPGKREATLQAIDAALQYCRDRNFEMISGRRKTLESALNRMKSLLRRAGMTGAGSFHALRCLYALDSAESMLDAGVDPYTTLVRLSQSLGHGASRTRMILNYYCQPVRHRFEGYLRLEKAEAHLRRPAKALPRAAARREAKLRHASLSGHPIGSISPPPRQDTDEHMKPQSSATASADKRFMPRRSVKHPYY